MNSVEPIREQSAIDDIAEKLKDIPKEIMFYFTSEFLSEEEYRTFFH